MQVPQLLVILLAGTVVIVAGCAPASVVPAAFSEDGETAETGTGLPPVTQVTDADAPPQVDSASGEKARTFELVVIEGRFPGESPVDVERQLSLRLAPEFAALPGATAIQSASWLGRGLIWVRLESGADSRLARQDAVARAALIQSQSPRRIQLSVSAGGGRSTLLLVSAHSGSLESRLVRSLAEFIIAPRLRAVRGVSDVALAGPGRTRLAIVVSMERLASQRLTIADVASAVGNEASIDSANLQPEEPISRFQEIVVGAREGQPLLLRDVAEVVFDQEPDSTDDELPAGDGPPGDAAAIIGLRLDDSTDAIAVRRAVSAVLDGIAAQLPPELKLVQQVPPQQEQLLKRAVREFQRQLPPGQRLVRVSADDLGDTLQVSQDHAAIRLLGPYQELLDPTAQDIAHDMESIDGIDEIQVEPMAGPTGLTFAIDPQRCTRFGIQRSDVAAVLQMLLHGQRVGQIWDGEIPCDVVIVSQETKGHTRAEHLAATIVKVPCSLPTGEIIPLGQLADIRMIEAPQVLLRQGMTRLSLVSFRIDATKSTDVIRRLKAAVVRWRATSKSVRLELDLGVGGNSFTTH